MKGILVAALIGLIASNAKALDPTRAISQYAHTAWGPKDGAPSVITALAQSADGYLWLGSADGLYRFDGIVFEPYKPQSGGPFPARSVSSLFALSNGDLWIGFRAGGISLLRNGNATSYTVRDGVPGGAVWSFAQDREETIWAATTSGLARLEGNQWKEVGKDWNFPGKSARAIFLDRQGTLWVSTGDTLVSLPPDVKKFQPTGIRVGSVPQIAQAADGKLWMAETTRSVRPIPLSDKRRPPDETEIQVGSQGILFDNDGALWITSLGDGLRRSPVPELLKGRIKEFSTAVESFTTKNGLSDDVALAILQDREGNIWVGSNNGLDRFRKTNLLPVVLPFKTTYAVVAAGEAGNVWVVSLGKVVRLPGERAEHGPMFPWPTFYAYRDPVGAIWWLCADAIYRYGAGNPAKLALPPSFPTPFVPSPIIATADGSGTLWLSAVKEGLFYREKGVWQQLESASEFAKLYPRTAFTDWMGRAWFGYEGGTIILLKDKTIVRIFPAADSPVGDIRAINGRGRHTWVGGEGGLAFFDGNRFRRIIPADAEAFGVVMGVEEAPDGSLWLAESRGVIQVRASEVQRALENPSYRVKYRIFDSFDGLSGTFAGTRINQKEIQGTDGKLWFVASGGVVSIDPANISTNPLPPPVLVRSVRANGKQLDSLTNLVLPPRTTNLQIGYAALSLSVPEKINFRYRLEGVDKDWQDAGTRREAFYNRLGPGEYHFRVLACNNDGVWNQTGVTLFFTVLPAWYQMYWFRTLSVLSLLGLIYFAYLLRMHQYAASMRARFHERFDERMRIARELHDTLLQSFHGLMFQFQAARNLLPGRPESAMQAMDEAILATEQALGEGRDAIRDLRPESFTQHNLAELLTSVGHELTGIHGADERSPTFRVLVEGEPRNLSQTLQDEIYRIGREVIRNAFHHAAASHIEAEIRYDERELRLRIRDDGTGIAPKDLEASGRPGHWGLQGIRERARRTGSRLEFWSEAGAGTEVELKVPAAMAYEKRRNGHRFKMFHWGGNNGGRH